MIGPTRKATVRLRCCWVFCWVLHIGLLLYGTAVHFPNVDEIGHLAAGVSYWEFERFDMYRVSPPLVEMVAGLPAWIAGTAYEWDLFTDAVGERPEFTIGRVKLVETALGFHKDLVVPRLFVIPFSLMGAVLLTLWTHRVFGAISATLVCAFWCFSPNILAHAQTIVPDVGAVALGVAACYAFWKYVRDPTSEMAVIAGLCLGLAMLTKLTWVTGLVTLPVTALACAWLPSLAKSRKKSVPSSRVPCESDSNSVSESIRIVNNLAESLAENSNATANARSTSQGNNAGNTLSVRRPRGWRRITDVLLMWVAAFVLLNVGYLFEGTGTQLRHYRFCSEMLGGVGCNATNHGNRFEDSWLGVIPVPVPKNYLLGIDYLKHEVEYKKWSFLRGKWKHGSWPYYYVFTTLVKTPEATLVAAMLGLLLVVVGLFRMKISYDAVAMLALLGVPAVVMFASVSLQGGFNHHHRYVLNIYPFLFVLAALPASRFAVWPKFHRWLAIVLTIAMIGSSLSIAPHYLSYFNAASGGPRNGWRLLAFSNIDWGQDILMVDRWIKEHPECRPLAIDLHYPGVNGKWFGLPSASRPPRLPMGATPSDLELDEPTWFIVNVRKLYNRPGEDGLEYLQQLEPVDRIAHSHHVYRVGLSE